MTIMMNQSRRGLLKSGLAMAAMAGLSSQVSAQGLNPRLSKLLATIADELLSDAPEEVSGLGLDHGAYAPMKYKLSDPSDAAYEHFVAKLGHIDKQLTGFSPKGLNDHEKLLRDTVLYSTQMGLEGRKFTFGHQVASGFRGRAVPYVISQSGGTMGSTPEFLNSQHNITNKDDAEAYLSRMSQIAGHLKAETQRFKHDAAKGVMAPDFVLANGLGQMKANLAKKAEDQGLVNSLVSRCAKLGIEGDWKSRAVAIIEQSIYPALSDQITAVGEGLKKATSTAGVGHLPDGEAYYAWALKLGTTTSHTPKEVHEIGLAQNAELKARMDVLLQKQGLTKGSVSERVQALNSDPRFLYPNTDQGRADLIAYLNDCLARIRPLLPKVSHLGLKADVMVKRVPVDIQDGAALGYMNFASLDGSRPAIYYVNLKSTDLWPKYQLPTLTAHEGVPGHTWQGAYIAEHHKDIPLMSSMLGFNAFVEGWALYAEQLMDENGLYADDPFGEIGYLQAQQFRACRLVADTGLHAMGWSRDQAIQFLVEESARGKGAMTSETDRYCVWPGQACGYKMGHNEIVHQRALAMSQLGPKFDVAAFNDAIVKTCGVPLTLLPKAIDAYIAQAKLA